MVMMNAKASLAILSQVLHGSKEAVLGLWPCTLIEAVMQSAASCQIEVILNRATPP